MFHVLLVLLLRNALSIHILFDDILRYSCEPFLCIVHSSFTILDLLRLQTQFNRNTIKKSNAKEIDNGGIEMVQDKSQTIAIDKRYTTHKRNV